MARYSDKHYADDSFGSHHKTCAVTHTLRALSLSYRPVFQTKQILKRSRRPKADSRGAVRETADWEADEIYALLVKRANGDDWAPAGAVCVGGGVESDVGSLADGRWTDEEC